jgi:hypothetical protein
MLRLFAFHKVLGHRAWVVLSLISLVPFLAHADVFYISFTGDLTGTGSFTTDGTCQVCSFPGSLLTATVSLGANTGSSAFDTVDDSVALNFDRTLNFFDPSIWTNSETGQNLYFLPDRDWELGTNPQNFVHGKYSVSSVPEPGSVSLFLTVIATVTLVGRKRRIRPGARAMEE